MNGFFRLLLASREDKEVSTETDGWDWVLFLTLCLPPSPTEDQALSRVAFAV